MLLAKSGRRFNDTFDRLPSPSSSSLRLLTRIRRTRISAPQQSRRAGQRQHLCYRCRKSQTGHTEEHSSATGSSIKSVQKLLIEFYVINKTVPPSQIKLSLPSHFVLSYGTLSVDALKRNRQIIPMRIYSHSSVE